MKATAGDDDVWVLGLGGSMRPGSRSRLVALTALTGARAAGARVSMWSVDEDPLPFYQPQEPLGPVAERFLKLVRGADAYIWNTPAYHGSISAPVKNLLDYIDAFRHDQPYVAAKMGLLGMTRVLAMEAQRYGIRVSTVSPGATDSAEDGVERCMRPASVGEIIAAAAFTPPDIAVSEIIVRPTGFDG